MKRKLIAALFALTLAWLVAIAPATAQGTTAGEPDWREQYAYTLGVQAYVYGFPWVYLPTVRYLWVTQPRDPQRVPYAALNQFWNAPQLADAKYRDGGSPNNDTLYSAAWVDVSKEPVILSHPDMGERYFTFEIADMSSDNFAYVGKRTTGPKAGNFAIVGPGWKGTLPSGVQSLPPSSTPYVLILGRTLVSGEADVPNVNKLQQQYRLTPLSQWGKADFKSADDRNVWPPFNPKTDPLADWKTMNKAMTENPPSDKQAVLLQLFATIGIGPGQDVDKMDESTKAGLARAAKDGRALLQEILKAGGDGKRVNGWSYPPPDLGRAGQHDDWVTRGAIQCLGGIISNDPAEAVYMNTFTDIAGKKLTGENRYVLHFKKEDFPQVNAFWSMTMYDLTYNLVANPINRYSIGNRT